MSNKNIGCMHCGEIVDMSVISGIHKGIPIHSYRCPNCKKEAITLGEVFRVKRILEHPELDNPTDRESR